MSNFEEIRKTWKNQSIDSVPSLPKVKNTITKYQRRTKRMILFYLMLSGICTAAMIWVMIHYHTTIWTTKVGELLMLFIGINLCVSKIAALQKAKNYENLSSQNYVNLLRKDLRTHSPSRIKIIQYCLLSIGFLLYVYEMLSSNLQYLVFGYTLLVVFLIMMWFVYRPFINKRQRKKTNNLLTKINRIKNQFDEKDKN